MSVQFGLLSIEDFGCIGKAEVELGDPGLVFVTGQNNDTDAAGSNGAGKSTIWKALTWCLYEAAVDGDRADTVIRRGAKRATVGLALTKHGGSVAMRIVRTRRKGSTKLAIFDGTGDDSVQIAASKAEAQAIIEDVVGLDFDSFRNTVLYGQNDSARFADPRTTDGQRKEMLRLLLKTGVYHDCYELACERRTGLRRDRQALETKEKVARSRLGEYDVDAVQREHAAWEESRSERVDRHIGRAREFKESAASMEFDDTRGDTLRVELETARERASGWDREDELEKLQNQQVQMAGEAAEVAADISTAQRDRDRIGRELQNLSGGTCPVCTAPLTSGAPKEFRAGLREKVDKAEDEIARKVEARAAFKDREADLHLKIRVAGTVANEHADDEKEVARLEHEVEIETIAEENFAAKVERVVEQAREALARASASRDEDNPHAERLETAGERVAEIEAELAEAQDGFASSSKAMALTEFWVRGFGSQGLPSLLLDSCMPVLTERANHYLGTLADGDITVEFTTQRELKSREGELRDEIQVNWTIEGYEGVTPSGGQLKKISIAVDLALMDLASSRDGEGVSLLALDEVLDGLDAEGRSRVLILLRELRATRGTVYVTSHEQDVSELFERTLIVEKTGGVAAVREAA